MKGDRKLVIGDMVIIKNTGKTYSTYVSAARTLGADFSDIKNENGIYDRKYRSSDKWRYGDVPTKNDIAVIRNIDDVDWRRDIILVERILDCIQFIMNQRGVEIHQGYFLEQELFEI